MSDPKSTENAAKESLPGNDPEVNTTAGDKLDPSSNGESNPVAKNDGSGISKTD